MSLLFNMLSMFVTEKAMAPHSSTLAWKIPWTEEPGRLQSMGSHRVGHDWSDLAKKMFVTAFLPRSKHLLISWLPSTSTVIWEPKKIKSVTSSTFSPSICMNPSVNSIQFSSVQFTQSCPTLWPHGLQPARPPSPSPTPRVYSNSCPLSRWWRPTMSSSVIPFCSHLQSFPESGSFPMSQFFLSAGQSIGVSASASVLPMNIQDWFPLGWTGWISLQSKGSQESSLTPQFKWIREEKKSRQRQWWYKWDGLL